MNRILGIDYGTKRIGLALSDDAGTMAFPYKILENNKRFIDEIGDIVKKEEIMCIVVGLPSSLGTMHDTAMTTHVRVFAKDIGKIGVPVELEPEFLSTDEAKDSGATKKEHIDASAAAIILQSYLERKKNMIQ